MEKYNNIYEKYQDLFGTIKKMCDDGMLVEGKSTRRESKCYILDKDKGIKVYIEGDVISLKASDGMDDKFAFEAFKNAFNEYYFRMKDKETLEGKGEIVYKADGRNRYYLTLDVDGDMAQSKNQIMGNLPTDDMKDILMNAKIQSKNQRTRDIYDCAISFYQDIFKSVKMYEQKANQKEEQKSEQSDKITTELPEEKELMKLTSKRLEMLLKMLEEENGEKKQKLGILVEKQDLIKAIKKEKELGEELDKKIAEAKQKLNEEDKKR